MNSHLLDIWAPTHVVGPVGNSIEVITTTRRREMRPAREGNTRVPALPTKFAANTDNPSRQR